jgi:hypothetical protein
MTNDAAKPGTFEEWAEKTGNRTDKRYGDLKACWHAATEDERERIIKWLRSFGICSCPPSLKNYGIPKLHHLVDCRHKIYNELADELEIGEEDDENDPDRSSDSCNPSRPES